MCLKVDGGDLVEAGSAIYRGTGKVYSIKFL